MGEIIANTEIKREPGKLYYCGTDEEGNLTICEAEMKRGGKKKDKSKKWKMLLQIITLGIGAAILVWIIISAIKESKNLNVK